MPLITTPESKQRVQRWASALRQRLLQINAPLKTLNLEPYDMKRWLDEGRQPQIERLTALIQRSVDPQIWRNIAEVIDWLALLNIPGHFYSNGSLIFGNTGHPFDNIHRFYSDIGHFSGDTGHIFDNIHRFYVALLLAGLPVLVVSELNPWFAVNWLPRYDLSLLITLPLSIALLMYTWLVGMSHKMAWLQWWLEIRSRHGDSQPQDATDPLAIQSA